MVVLLALHSNDTWKVLGTCSLADHLDQMITEIKISVVLHSGLQDMRVKLLSLGTGCRYVDKMGHVQRISTYVAWAIRLHRATSWELSVSIYDPQMAQTTHNSSGWASLPDCDICWQFDFIELWVEVVDIWRLLTFVFLLPLCSPYSVD